MNQSSSSSLNITCRRCGYPGADLRLQGCSCCLHARCVPLNLIVSSTVQFNGIPFPNQSKSTPCPICQNGIVLGIELFPMSFELLDKAIALRRHVAQAAALQQQQVTASSSSSTTVGSKKRTRSEDEDDFYYDELCSYAWLLSSSSSALRSSSSSGTDYHHQEQQNQQQQQHYRTGRWSPQEVALVDQLVIAFDQGSLPLPHGMKLNEYLGDYLMCKSSRLTKKMKHARLSTRNYCLQVSNNNQSSATSTKIVGLSTPQCILISQLQQAFLQSIPHEALQLEGAFGMSKLWRMHFSNLCLQVGYPHLNATAWLASLDEMECRAAKAQEGMRRARRRRMGRALRHDVLSMAAAAAAQEQTEATNVTATTTGTTSSENQSLKVHNEGGGAGVYIAGRRVVAPPASGKQDQQEHQQQQQQQPQESTWAASLQQSSGSTTKNNANNSSDNSLTTATTTTMLSLTNSVSAASTVSLPDQVQQTAAPPPPPPKTVSPSTTLNNNNNNLVVLDTSLVVSTGDSQPPPPPPQDYSMEVMMKTLAVECNNMEQQQQQQQQQHDCFDANAIAGLDEFLADPLSMVDGGGDILSSSLSGAKQFANNNNLFGDCGPFLENVIHYLESEPSCCFQHVDVWVPSYVPAPASSADKADASTTALRLCNAGHATRCDMNDPSLVLALNEFGMYSTHFSFQPKCGLPGRVFSSQECSWECRVCHAHPTHFERAGGAKVYGIQTALGIPLRASHDVGTIILVLYSTHHLERDVNLERHYREALNQWMPQPRWKLVIDLGGEEPNSETMAAQTSTTANTTKAAATAVGNTFHGDNDSAGVMQQGQNCIPNAAVAVSNDASSSTQGGAVVPTITTSSACTLSSDIAAKSNTTVEDNDSNKNDDDEEQQLVSLLGQHMPITDNAMLTHFMSLRLLLLRERRSSQEKEWIEIIKKSHSVYAKDKKRSPADLAVLITKDWMFLSNQHHANANANANAQHQTFVMQSSVSQTTTLATPTTMPSHPHAAPPVSSLFPKLIHKRHPSPPVQELAHAAPVIGANHDVVQG